jgi:hypothetical protein
LFKNRFRFLQPSKPSRDEETLRGKIVPGIFPQHILSFLQWPELIAIKVSAIISEHGWQKAFYANENSDGEGTTQLPPTDSLHPLLP